MPVLNLADLEVLPLLGILSRYRMRFVQVEPQTQIPGSYWGEPEAGIVGDRLYAREDTPVHSILHELSHVVCMDEGRRDDLDSNAGGGFEEENGVCYLQILLADCLHDVGRARMLADMDLWGYTFRLGSARLWFERDAEDAQQWLEAHRLIDGNLRPTWRLRGA
jgi:hypothetical protein